MAGIVGSQEFNDFLIEAKQHGYGADDSPRRQTESGAYVFEYGVGPFRYVDTYVGGNPYIGFEHVSHDSNDRLKPVWAMNYAETDLVVEELSGHDLFQVMKKVLVQPDPELPVRGPRNWEEGDLRYWMRPVSRGASLEKFEVEEFIAKGGRRVYRARFIGSLVNYM